MRHRITVLLLAVLSLTACRTLYPGLGPWPYRGDLHARLVGADRIVVRTGGDICCTPPEEIPTRTVYFQVTDANEVAEAYKHLQFHGSMVAGNSCLCCGGPALDWYQGAKRLGTFTWKHGTGIEWDRFVVAPLQEESIKWFRAWFIRHGVPPEKLD